MEHQHYFEHIQSEYHEEWNELDPFWQAVEEHFANMQEPKAVPQEFAGPPGAKEFEELLAQNTRKYYEQQEQAREEEEHEHE